MKPRPARSAAVRVTAESLYDALTAVWPQDAVDPPCHRSLAAAVIQHVVTEARKARPTFNVTHVAYLREAASEQGIRRGPGHSVLVALARDGLVQFEAQRWTATPKGLAWLEKQPAAS